MAGSSAVWAKIKKRYNLFIKNIQNQTKMKKRFLKAALAVMLGSCVLFSSCIGSFGLSNKMLSWNKNVGSKFVNELVFIAFSVLQVYSVTLVADALVLNSIEFWTGSNPVADNAAPEKVQGANGEYTVQQTENGYHIEKEGEVVATDLLFNEQEQSWNVSTADGELIPLFKYNSEKEVVMYMPNGEEMTVDLSKSGVMAFREAVANSSAYAMR